MIHQAKFVFFPIRYWPNVIDMPLSVVLPWHSFCKKPFKMNPSFLPGTPKKRQSVCRFACTYSRKSVLYSSSKSSFYDITGICLLTLFVVWSSVRIDVFSVLMPPLGQMFVVPLLSRSLHLFLVFFSVDFIRYSVTFLFRQGLSSSVHDINTYASRC